MEPVGICPQCERELDYVQDGPPEEPRSANNVVRIKLASIIGRCPDHGLFRVYISGAVTPYRERDDEREQ